MVLPVCLGNIGDDLVTAFILKVQVDIRHLLALHIEETLEDQSILNRVNLSDTETVQDNTGGSATSDTKGDILLFGKGDDIPDHQKVIGKLGLADYFQFVLQTLFYLRRSARVITGQAFVAEVGQKLVGSLVRRQFYLGQVQAPEVQLEVAHLGDALGVF